MASRISACRKAYPSAPAVSTLAATAGRSARARGSSSSPVTAASSGCPTCGPAALAARKASCVSSGSRPTVARSRSRSESGSTTVGPPLHLVGQRRFGLTAEDARNKLVGVQPGKPRQLHTLHPPKPAKLGKQRAKRMGAVQLIGPVGNHDQHPVQDLLIADQERQQIEG